MAKDSVKYSIPYPEDSDPVDITNDIKVIVDRLETILPPLGVSYFEILVRNETGNTIPAGYPVYAVGSNVDSNSTVRTKIDISTPTITKPILGLTKTSLGNNSNGVVVVAGVVEGVNTSSFLAGDVLYVADGGGLTKTRPASGGAAVGIVGHAATTGVVIVQAKGNGTWGALKDGLS